LIELPECLPAAAKQQAGFICAVQDVNPGSSQCNQYRAKLESWIKDLLTCAKLDQSEQRVKYCNDTIGKFPPPPSKGESAARLYANCTL